MKLSLEQQAAARASGLALLPATDEQVARLTMQRRVLRVGGRPFLATLDGGYFETHATFAALIGPYLPEAMAPGAVPKEPRAEAPPARPGERSPEGATGIIPSGPSAAARPGAEPECGGAPARMRKPRTRPTEPEAKPTAAAPADGSGAEDAPSAVEEVAAAAEATPGRGLAVARRRAGQPKTPRWMTAGRVRRGRPV